MRPRDGSLTPRPFLFSSSASWIALDFALVLAIAALTQAGRWKDLLCIQSGYLCALAGLPFALLVPVLAHFLGLYQKKSTSSLFIDAIRIGQAVVLAGLGLYGLQKLWGITALSNDVIGREAVLAGAAMFLGRTLWRSRREHLYRRDIALQNFLIVGVDEIGQDVRSYLTSLRSSGYRFQGFVSMCEPTDNLLAVNEDEIAGEIQNVVDTARSRFVDEIIFSRRPATPGVLSRILRQAQAQGISVRLIPSLTETLIDRADVQYIGDLPTIAVYLAEQRRFSLFVKRAIDVVFATLASVALLPVFAALAIVIKLQSPGPAFYVSKRIGQKRRVFNCIKFRTMVDNAAAMQEQLSCMNERDKVAFKISKDPRVTAFGAFLRKYSLDELPQLWNVIRGDMSLVGPRPPLDSEVAQYDPEHLRRLDAVPGITGLWQVEARQDPSFDKFVALDSSYINHWSLGLDLRILLRTISAVIHGTGS
jgi:exopolysaccharide biosynthesis polyprenyl glycosylphosphotransferase